MSNHELFAVAVLALFAKHLLVVTVQAYVRFTSKAFRHAEDAKLLNAAVGDPPLAERAQHLLRNGFENEPIFLFLLWALLELDASEHASTYVLVFLAARYLHAILFLARLAPWRTIVWTVGLLAAAGVATELAIAVL